MKSDNPDVIITWEKHTKNANNMPIPCQSWHIPKSKGIIRLTKSWVDLTKKFGLLNKMVWLHQLYFFTI